MLGLSQLRHHIQILNKGDENSRQKAIHSLKAHDEGEWAAAPVEVIPPLVKSLQTQLLGIKQPSIRQEVATILGNMGPHSEPAIPQLIELLQEGIPDAIREASVVALGKIGKKAKAAVDQLIVLLSNRRTTLAVQAVRALGDIGCADQRVRVALVNLWLSPSLSQTGKAQIAIALCKLKIDTNGLLHYLTHAMVSHQEARVRKSAAEALAWCNKTEVGVVPALLVAARIDKDEEVRLIAEAGLTQLRLSQEKAIQVCAKQLKESSYAETALKNCGQLAVPSLIEALGMGDATIRERASRTLGSLGELAAEAAPALTKTLHDRDLDVRLAAAKGLWNITKNAELVVPVLIHLLEEKGTGAADDAEARRRFLQTVIESLWRIGPPAKAAIPALTQRSKDKNRLISESALNALKQIGPAPAKTASR